jgi:hypothetical protein
MNKEVTTIKKETKSKKELKVMALLDEATKKRLDFLCDRDDRNMSNMILYLINKEYKAYEDNYDEALKLRGKITSWEGDLDAMSENRINYDNN